MSVIIAFFSSLFARAASARAFVAPVVSLLAATGAFVRGNAPARLAASAAITCAVLAIGRIEPLYPEMFVNTLVLLVVYRLLMPPPSK